MSPPSSLASLRVALLGLVLVATGCTETRTLTIELQTDLSPALELGHVTIEVLPRFVPADEVGAPVHTTTYEPSAADATELHAGRRVAEVELRPGTYTVRLVGRRPVPSGADPGAGHLVAERDLVTTLMADRVVRVVVARGALVAEERCRVSTSATSCPGAEDDPRRAEDRATECLNGQCVDPRCDPSAAETGEYCCEGPSCTADARCSDDGDCADAGVSCADPRCVDGACILIDRAGACEADEYCDRTDGACAPASGATLRDAGVPDAGVPDAGPPDDADPLLDACHPEVCGNGLDDDCDSAVDCEDTECAGTPCDDDDPCTHTDVCAPAAMAAGRCVGTSVSCVSTECVMRTCNGTATCTEAPIDGPCATDGNECTNDVCVLGTCTHPASVDGQRCSLGRCCSGTCFDVLTDPTNCGVCGIRCPGVGSGGGCSAGACDWYSTTDCIAAGYGSLASSYMNRCQCRCNLDSMDSTTRCTGQCPGSAVCQHLSGVNACLYPGP